MLLWKKNPVEFSRFSLTLFLYSVFQLFVVWKCKIHLPINQWNPTFRSKNTWNALAVILTTQNSATITITISLNHGISARTVVDTGLKAVLFVTFLLVVELERPLSVWLIQNACLLQLLHLHHQQLLQLKMQLWSQRQNQMEYLANHSEWLSPQLSKTDSF